MLCLWYNAVSLVEGSTASEKKCANPHKYYHANYIGPNPCFETPNITTVLDYAKCIGIKPKKHYGKKSR